MLRSLFIRCSVLVLIAMLTYSAFAQQTPPSPLRGAWLLSEIVEGPSPNASPLPSLSIFTDRHYSAMAVIGPRPRFAPGQATDADKLATYDAFAGNSGTYEVSGATVTMHPIVSKNEYMMGSTPRAEFKVDGDTLTWTTMLGPTRLVSKFRRLE